MAASICSGVGFQRKRATWNRAAAGTTVDELDRPTTSSRRSTAAWVWRSASASSGHPFSLVVEGHERSTRAASIATPSSNSTERVMKRTLCPASFGAVA